MKAGLTRDTRTDSHVPVPVHKSRGPLPPITLISSLSSVRRPQRPSSRTPNSPSVALVYGLQSSYWTVSLVTTTPLFRLTLSPQPWYY